MTLDSGRVGIGTTNPLIGKLHVDGGSGDAVYGTSTGGIAVYGLSTGGSGVYGYSTDDTGVYGYSPYGDGVFGVSSTGYAGRFNGNVYVTGTVTQNSDARLKQGVRNLGYGLHEVMRLRPVAWTWKQTSDERVQLGLLAQEVEAVVPELVTTDHDADHTKGINYVGLVPVAIKAIQEQQDVIAMLKAENSRLRQQNTTLDARLTALEQALKPLLGRQQGHVRTQSSVSSNIGKP